MSDTKIDVEAPPPTKAGEHPTSTVSAPAPAPSDTPAKEAESVTKTDAPSTLPAPPAEKTPAPAADGGVAVDKSKPQEFDGELQTSNELPSAEVLRKVEDYIVLDRDGKTHTFKSLYSGNNVARRVLVIFIRHFFCGNCQEYLRSVSESITPDALLQLPVSTFITVIGCGDPGLIEMYANETKCPFPIYTDPTRSLFNELGMVKTMTMGAKPAYVKKSVARGIIDGVTQGLKFGLAKGLATKSGDYRQVGGEFLFEPLDIVTPVTTPHEEHAPQIGSFEEPGYGVADKSEEKRVTWCHRMKSMRDHAEVPELFEILGLDGHGQPIKDEKLWDEALRKRKGTGLSMASQMSKLTLENAPPPPVPEQTPVA